MVAVNDPNGNDFIYPYFNWSYFYYIAPAIAGILILCVMASYCFRMCQSPRSRGIESERFFGSSNRSWRRNPNGTNNLNRRQDPYETNQYYPWSNQRRQRRYERMRGQNNAQAGGVVGHQYYPPSTNTMYNGQGQVRRNHKLCQSFFR